jgi:flagellar motor switch protein FliM
MTARDVLSEDEVNALLEGVAQDKIDTSDKQQHADVNIFDFTAQDRIVSARLPALNTINERFVRSFRASLMNLLRRHIDVKVANFLSQKSGEYFGKLNAPICINIVRPRPLIGTAFIVVSYRLIYLIVHYLFGGEHVDEQHDISTKELTQMEIRISDLVLEHILEDMREAWRATYPLEPEAAAFETNPQLINSVSQSETLIVNQYRVGISGLYAEVDFCIPYSVLEPIRSELDEGGSDQTEINENWATQLREEVFDSPLLINGNIAEKSVSLREVLALKEGDVIAIELKPFVTIFAAGIPVFRGKFGISNGKNAVKIIERAKKT